MASTQKILTGTAQQANELFNLETEKGIQIRYFNLISQEAGSASKFEVEIRFADELAVQLKKVKTLAGLKKLFV